MPQRFRWTMHARIWRSPSCRCKISTTCLPPLLKPRGLSLSGQDQDDNLLMPYTTVMKKIKGQTWLDDIMCSATSASVVDQAEQEIAALMREDTMEQIKLAARMFAGLIAAAVVIGWLMYPFPI